jgi:3-phenylpropionate/trans-cinnamate dioxygenase ferredoxin component
VTERRVASLADVPDGRPMAVDIEGTRVVLARVGDAVYACGDVCTHRGGHLSEGRLRGPRLACPLHGWIYDVRTGQCLVPSRGEGVPSFRVRVDVDSVFVEVP